MAAHTVPDTRAELDVSRVMHCMETTDGVRKLYDHVAATAEKLGYHRPEGIQVGGLSDAGLLVAAGIPTLCGMGYGAKGPIHPGNGRKWNPCMNGASWRPVQQQVVDLCPLPFQGGQ